MRLAELLSYADIAQLIHIAETYDCRCNSHSKNDLIQSILHTALRRDAFAPHLDELSPEEWQLLHSLLFDNRDVFSSEELAARAASAANHPSQSILSAGGGGGASVGANGEAAEAPTASAARSAIARFRRLGWLFGGISQQTRFLYHMPLDVKQRLCETLEQRYRLLLEVRDEPPVYRDERGLFGDDIVTFLRYVRDYDVPLTTEGALYKRQLQQVLALMSVTETPPSGQGWRFGYGRRFKEYPDRFSLLYDYCYYHRLVEERPDRLALTEAGYETAGGETRPDPAEVYRFWLRLYKGPVTNLHVLVQWIARLAVDWVTERSLAAVLLPLVRPFYYDTVEDVLERRVLRMMTHLGLVQRGETEQGEAVVRVTPHGRELVTGNRLAFEDTLWLPGMA